MDEPLPLADTVERFAAVRRDDARLRGGVGAICRRHRLGGEVARMAGGSLPVYGVGAADVLKLYPPCYRGDFDIERACLELLAGRLPAPTPRIRAAGEQDGWAYVVMERLAGVSLAEAWPALSPGERERLVADLGEAIAALHAVAPVPAAVPRPDWPAFLAAQRASCVARHQAGGLGAPWPERIPPFLDAVALDDPRRVLLHTEVMREHVFVATGPRGPALSGLLDFEPAMVGAPEYELASVGLFVACGERPLLRRFLLAYGYAPAALDEALARRILAYALLHRYGNLRWYLERLPAVGAGTLEVLAARWFGA